MTTDLLRVAKRFSRIHSTALFLAALALAAPAAGQQVYRFYESGGPQTMVLAPSELAVKARADASDANVTDALRRHIPQVATLEKWDSNYLVFIPPTHNVRSLTSKSAPIRQESVIIESAPVLYVMQNLPRPKNGQPTPGNERRHRLATMRIVTRQVVANLSAGSNAAGIRQSTSALSASAVGFGGWWLFTYETPLEALDGAYWITETARLEATPVFEKMGFARQTTTRLIPNDPLYANQWHLVSPLHGINSIAAWDTRQGTGRHIAIIDDGLQLAHPDLTANTYNVASLNNFDFNGNDNDPTPGAPDNHGTACAGLAAGRGNNAVGITGVAFMAKLLGLRLIAGPFSELNEQSAFTWKPLLTDVSSNSWGPSDDGATLAGPGPTALAGLQTAVTSGRGGKGVVFTWAGGNGRTNDAFTDESNYDGYANSRYVVAVGAATDAGQQAFYSESGANIAVVAPSNGGTLGLTTTDRTGADGYNATDYTSTFGGTSGAAPIVAGVAALVIEANPNLTYRDVKQILMMSASRVNLSGGDPFVTNGSGIPFSHSFGAGRVNATAAVTMASSWINLPAEQSITFIKALPQAIPDNNATGVTTSFDMSTFLNLRAETVELTVNITHPFRGDLQFVITAPSGMQSTILRRPSDNGDNFNWTFTSVRHLGEFTSGTWTVKVADLAGADVGTLNSVGLKIWGTPVIATVPDLTITKTHSGNFTQGQTGATYTITVSNGGSAATTGTVTVADTLPTGLTATGIGGTGWNCTAPAGPCTRSNALSPATSYPPITLTVNVSASAAASVTNTATVSGGGESNTANNTATDPTTVTPTGGGGGATVTIVNADPAGVGFNDPTPVAPVGGNPGTTRGQQRLNALQAAANKWGATLASSVPINIRTVWVPLTCDATSAVLASAGAAQNWRDFTNAPVPSRWYPVALANKFVGSDLDATVAEINANFNINLGQAGCIPGTFYYLGLDNNHGSSIDLFAVALHEFGHGLGFQTITNASTGALASGFPSRFDDFLLDNVSNKTWSQMTAAERVASAINTTHLVWNGPAVTADIPSVITAGKDASGRALMYAPNPVQPGSSVSHWDTTMTPNQLMEPAINGNLTHEVTPPQDLTFSLFKDLGWTAPGTSTPGLHRFGVYRTGWWYVDYNGNAQWDAPDSAHIVNYGGDPADIPITADWNGDGRRKIGVYRNGWWFIDYNGNGQWDATDASHVFNFGGAPGDIPVVGDWNGDGRLKIGIYRGGFWFVDWNGNLQWDATDAAHIFNFGGAGDIPVLGDWNGDGRYKFGVYRNGWWFVDWNGNGQWDATDASHVFNFGGAPGDIPVSADWNADGRLKFGIYRNGWWYVDWNGNGQWDATDFAHVFNFGGAPSDKPVAGTWSTFP